MGADVSASALGIHLNALRGRDADIAALFAGTALDPAKLPPFIDWNTFALLTRRLGALVGGPEGLELLGQELIKTPSLQGLVTVLRIGVTPRQLYHGNVKWGGPRLFRSLSHISFTPVNNDVYQIQMRLREVDDECPEFFYLNKGLFQTLPRLIGMTQADVDLVLGPREGLFTVRAPPAVNLPARIRRLWRAFTDIFRGTNSPLEVSFEALISQQDHLRTVNAELERARVVAEEQRRIAEDALAVKSRFLATMSHELRTPLNGILGVADLLTVTPLTPEQREYSLTIRSSGQSLLSVIEDVLQYSRLESGHAEIESVTFDVRELVEQVVALFAVSAHDKGLEIIGRVSPDVPSEVRGPAREIRQILQNLVNNAVKFTDSGEVDVTVSTLPTHGLSAQLLFSVRDTGLGISEADQQRLFSPFTQLDASNTRAYAGTGLGLAICRELARRIHSDVVLHSRPRQGSTFSFVMKLADESTLPAAPPYAGRWLVVDDNPRAGAAIVESLARLGADADAVSTASQAYALVAEASWEGKPFQGVMLDASMPDRAAASMINVFRANEASSLLRVVLLARATPDTNQTEALNCVGVETLRKPARFASIRALLAPPPPDAVGALEGPWTAPKRPDGRPWRVLVVEDHIINRKVCVSLLNALQVHSDVAHDGVEALEMMAKTSYDVVLMDCQMPRMDGLEATRVWRSREVTHRVPIIAVTAHATPQDRAACLDAGMDDFLTKPVELARLGGVLRRWMGLEVHPVVESNRSEVEEASTIRARIAEIKPMFSQSSLRDLAQEFEREALVDLAALEAAVARADAVAADHAAHRLKGSCHNIGANRTASTCARVVAMARSRALPAVSAELPGLRKQVEQASTVLYAQTR
jgi:two-component system sensor histidine kinase/response regulator